jgi:hypothetical protein
MLKTFFFAFIILITLFLGFYAGYSQSGQTQKYNKKNNKKRSVSPVRKADLKEIIKSQSLQSINDRVCGYNKYLCNPGAVLLKSKSVRRDFRELYIAVLLTESDDFKFDRGIYNKYDYGYPQINIKFWTLSKILRMGYKITSYNELLSRPVLAIKIGEAIFWHNFIETWQNNNYPSLLEYATGYHNIACVSKVYYKRLTKNYLNLKIGKFRKKILAMSFKTYNNIN